MRRSTKEEAIEDITYASLIEVATVVVRYAFFSKCSFLTYFAHFLTVRKSRPAQYASTRVKKVEHFPSTWSQVLQMLTMRKESKLWRCGDDFEYRLPEPEGDPWNALLKPLSERDAIQCSAWVDEVQNMLIFVRQNQF